MDITNLSKSSVILLISFKAPSLFVTSTYTPFASTGMDRFYFHNCLNSARHIFNKVLENIPQITTLHFYPWGEVMDSNGASLKPELTINAKCCDL